jgi:hypothetical protein
MVQFLLPYNAMVKVGDLIVQFLLSGTRSLSVLALGAALASAMAFAPGADARTAAPPNLQNPVLLFERQGTGLVHALDKHFYGPGNHDDALQVTSRGILFDPTDAQDHLATPWFTLPFAFWQRRHVVVELGVSAKDAEADSLLVTVQRDGYLNVVGFTPDPAQAVSGTWSVDVLVPRLARQIRLVITSADENVARVPSKIAIWSEDPPLPLAGLIMVSVIVISFCVLFLCALIWVMRRRSARAPAANA